MGKGDKKSKKGKIAIGSYGNSRKRHANKPEVKSTPKATAGAAEAPVKPKKTPRKKSEA